MGRLSLLAFCLLMGCAAHHPVAGHVVCPSVKSFSAEWQRELAQDLGAIPGNSPIMDMTADWERMRDESRACAK